MDTTPVTRSSEIEGAPAEIQVIPFGSHATPHGSFVLDKAGIEEIIAEFGGRRNDMVIDYEHQSLGGSEAPAAGWIKRLMDKGADGLWAAVEWTPRAMEYLAFKEYRYLSPVFMKRVSDNRAVRLINAALTNQPAIDGMVPLVNRAINPLKEGGQDMLKIFDILGIAPEKGEQEALAAISAMRARLDSVLGALGLSSDATDAELTGTASAMKQSHEQLPQIAAKLAELEAALGGKEAEGLVEQAMSLGKLTPAQKQWAAEYAHRDIEGFKVFVAKAPVVVPVSQASHAKAATRAQMDETQHRVNAYLGITAEAFNRFGN